MAAVCEDEFAHDATIRMNGPSNAGDIVGEYTGEVYTHTQLIRLRKSPEFCDTYVLALPHSGRTARKYLDGNVDSNALKHIRFAQWNASVNCVLEPSGRDTFLCRLVRDVGANTELFAQPVDGPPAKTPWEVQAEDFVTGLQHTTRQWGVDALSAAAGIIDLQDLQKANQQQLAQLDSSLACVQKSASSLAGRAIESSIAQKQLSDQLAACDARIQRLETIIEAQQDLVQNAFATAADGMRKRWVFVGLLCIWSPASLLFRNRRITFKCVPGPVKTPS